MHSKQHEDTTRPNKPFMYHHVEEIPFSITNSKGEVITFSPFMHLLAGASAGAIEHVCMFPIDTLKTRMQQAKVQPMYKQGVVRAISTIIKENSATELYRGISAVLVGALPSHALYFATYEFVKRTLKQQQQHDSFSILHSALAGISATMVHDAISTPLDVVKQRMQMHASPYKSMLSCIKQVAKLEGLSAFYLSYPTTILMNIPYACIHFVTYEWMTHVVFGEHHHDDDDPYQQPIADDSRYNMIKHVVSGAVAGACGAAISNPFDVIKTRLQTQQEYTTTTNSKLYLHGIRDTARHIYSQEGMYGFAKGVIPRVLYFVPSAAITWTVYEYIKYIYHKWE